VKVDARRTAGIIGLAVGLSMAIAANLAYSWPKGAVVIGVGLCCPLVLPLALWIRSTLPKGGGWWKRLSMELATLLVAGPAAAISYAHSYSLLLAHDPRWAVIAILAPLSADGLAALSTLALSVSARPGERRTTTNKTRSPAKAASAPRPRVEAAPAQSGDYRITPALVAIVPATLADRVAVWLIERRRKHGVRSIAEEAKAAREHFNVVSTMTVRRARQIATETPAREATS